MIYICLQCLSSWWLCCSWGTHWPLLTVMTKMMHLLSSQLVINALLCLVWIFSSVTANLTGCNLGQLFLLRAAGFLLPCYIMAWAVSIMQRQRQRQVGLIKMFLPCVFSLEEENFHNYSYRITWTVYLQSQSSIKLFLLLFAHILVWTLDPGVGIWG